MKSLRQRPTVLKETLMQRPDLDTLTCVNPACQHFRRPGAAHLTVRQVYDYDRIRLLRCRTCGEEFSSPPWHRSPPPVPTTLLLSECVPSVQYCTVLPPGMRYLHG